MKLTKRAISLLLTLLMVVGCLSGLSLTASAASYGVWVLGTQVTDANKNDVLEDGGSVRYNPTLSILYLTSAGTLSGQTENHNNAVIYADGALTLDLSGNTTVQAAQFGVRAGGDLSIHGDGRLTAYGTDSAIYAGGTLYLDDEENDPTVIAQGTAYGVRVRSAVLLRGNLTAQTNGGGTGTLGSVGLYVTSGKLELGSSDPRVFRNSLSLNMIGHTNVSTSTISPAVYAAGGIELSACMQVTAPQNYQLSGDRTGILTSGGKQATQITVQPKTSYRISLTADGGTITTNQPGDRAFPGQRVSLTFTPDAGYSLFDLFCLDGDGNPLALTHTGDVYSFVMPENSAEIYALFDVGTTYGVDNAVNIEHGAVIPDYNRQIEGETVFLTVVPDPGYAYCAGTISAKDAGGNNVQLTDEGSDSYSFTMPASDVTLYAEFEMVGGLYVCGVEVTSANAADILGNNTARYDAATCTLTLNYLSANADLYEGATIWTILPELTITGNGNVYSDKDGAYYGIFAENTDLTLAGNLTISGTVGVKAKSLAVRDVGNLLRMYRAQISGKVTVSNSVNRLMVTKRLNCEALVLGDQEYIYSPEGGTASSVINRDVDYIRIDHGEKHSVTVVSSFYGTVTVDKTEAFPGETVHLTATADAGCALDSLTVTHTNDSSQIVLVSGDRFNMPDTDVAVTANFHMSQQPEAASYDLFIGNVQVTSSNYANPLGNGTVSYNPFTQTLYLKDYKGVREGDAATNIPKGAVIWSAMDLTIEGYGYIGYFSYYNPSDLSLRSNAPCGIDAQYHNVTIRGDFSIYAEEGIRADTVTFDGGSTTIKQRVPAVNAGTVTITDNNTRLYCYPRNNLYYPAFNQGTTLVLGEYQKVTKGASSAQALPGTAAYETEIRHLYENTVTVNNGDGGWVTAASPKAYESHIVELTIEPKEGYTIESVTAVDADNNPVDVTVSGNKATFQMPASAVTVTPVFEPGYAVYVASATHGSVTVPENAYGIGETVTLTVEQIENGYELDELSLFASNGRPVALTKVSDTTYTFPMPACDVSVAPRFARQRYTVSKAAAQNGSFTVSGEDANGVATVRFGDVVTVTPAPDAGYSVQSVTVNNSDTEVTQDGGVYRFVMSAANVTVTVSFAHTLYTVAVDDMEHGTVTADKAGAYYGDTVTLTVTPDRTYFCTSLALIYDGSAHPLQLSGDTCSFTMPDADVTVAASFVAPDFRINVNAEHGTVTASPNPAKYSDTVTLTPTPDTGYRLTGLLVDGEDLMENAPVTPTLTAINGNRIGGGEEYYRLVDGDLNTRWFPNEVPPNNMPYMIFKTDRPICLTDYTLTTAHDLTSNPSSNWKSWTIYGANFDNDSAATQNAEGWQAIVTVVDDTRLPSQNRVSTQYVLDTPAAQYQYYKVVVNAGQGTDRVRMGELSVRGLLKPLHDEADRNWTFTMPAKDVTVTPTFTAIDYQITAAAHAHAVTTVPETAHYGDRVRPTATVDEGWRLKGFTITDEDGTVLPTYVDDSFDMPAKNVTVTPVLEAASYTIAVLPAEHGAVTVNKSLASCGDEISFTVTPEDGYQLLKLRVMNFSYETVYQSATASEYTFTMPAANLIVVAQFVQGRYSISTQSQGHGTIEALPAAADAGVRITLVDTPDAGYALDTLTVVDALGNPVAVENMQFTMPESNVTVTASFNSAYTVTIDGSIENGTVTSDKAIAAAGATVTLTVTPDACYELDSLTVGVPVTPALTYLRGSREDGGNGDTSTLLDGSKDTKWCEAVSHTPYIIFKADRAFCLTDYTLTTAADTATYGDRNWKDWTIYGANFASDDEALPDAEAWQPVVSVTGDTTLQAANGEDYTFTLNEAAPAYQYYKIVITASRGASEIQMSRLSMYGLVKTPHSSSGSDVTFTMPEADVIVSATFAKVKYAVTVTPSANGTVTADKDSAGVGETVTLTVTPDGGCMLQTLNVTDANGDPVAVENNQFTMPASNVTVSATFDTSVPYVDARGNAMTPVDTYSTVKSDTTELTEGWWVVTGSITNSNRLTVSGAVNLILMDGVTLTIPSGICVSRGNSLTIWAQSQSASRGKLVAILNNTWSDGGCHAAIGGNEKGTLGTIVINGGDITATGGYTSAGIGLGRCGAPQGQAGGTIEIHNGIVTATGRGASAGIGGGYVMNEVHYGDLDTIIITGGVVTATSGGRGAAGIGGGGRDSDYGKHAGNVNRIEITGGRVTATSSNGYGIGPGLNIFDNDGTKHGTVGSVIFGWTNADDDFIQSSKNVSADKIQFVDGKAFYIDGDPLVDATTDNIQNACKLIPNVNASVTYQVTVGSIENGTVTTDKATATAGETVTLTVTPADGYELESLTVKDASNNAVAVSAAYTFTMPASDVTVSASFVAAAPVTYTYFVGNSLTLEGEIGVNFYVKLNDVAKANARVVFTWGSGSRAGSQTTALSGLEADSNNLYKLTVRVAAAQMTDTITAKLYDGETLVGEQQYSVAQYARYAIGMSADTLSAKLNITAAKAEQLQSLCRAMLIYGARSQLQFKYNTWALADQGLVYTLDTPGTLGTTVFPDGFADACGIAFYGASLVLDSTTTYRLYFTVTDQAKLDALTVTCGGKTLTYATKDDMVYFDVADIAAAYVFKDYTVSFGSTDVTVNAGSYVTGVLGGSNETLKDAVKALYAYSEAARTFFGVQ